MPRSPKPRSPPFRIYVDEQFDDVWQRFRREIKLLNIRDKTGKRYKLSAILQDNGEYDPERIRNLLGRAAGDDLWDRLEAYGQRDERAYVIRDPLPPSAHRKKVARKSQFTPFRWDIKKLADDLFEAIFYDRIRYTSSLRRRFSGSGVLGRERSWR
jgi:hypothetical protein